MPRSESSGTAIARSRAAARGTEPGYIGSSPRTITFSERTPLPVHRKGLATRAKIMVAAEAVFSQSSFTRSKLSEITKLANVAEGTFYTYFASKREILYELLETTLHGLNEDMDDRDPSLSVLERIADTNRKFISHYQGHTGLLRVFEEVAAIDEEFRALRRNMRRRHAGRTERMIRRLQERGEIDSALDPRYTAFALVVMVDNFIYNWLGLGEDFEADKVEESLTLLWARSLGLEAR